MKPVNSCSHAAYKQRVLAQLRKYYPDATNSISPSAWEIVEKFWSLDLSEVDSIIQSHCSVFKIPARMQKSAERSFLP